MTVKRCPKCGHNEFCVSAHVVQDWKVDRSGNFMYCIDDCVEVVHFPDDQDIWDCANCGYSDAGEKFNVELEEGVQETDPVVDEDVHESGSDEPDSDKALELAKRLALFYERFFPGLLPEDPAENSEENIVALKSLFSSKRDSLLLSEEIALVQLNIAEHVEEIKHDPVFNLDEANRLVEDMNRRGKELFTYRWTDMLDD